MNIFEKKKLLKITWSVLEYRDDLNGSSRILHWSINWINNCKIYWIYNSNEIKIDF